MPSLGSGAKYKRHRWITWSTTQRVFACSCTVQCSWLATVLSRCGKDGPDMPTHIIDSSFRSTCISLHPAVWKLPTRVINIWAACLKLATMSADTVWYPQVTKSIIQHCWQVTVSQWTVWITCMCHTQQMEPAMWTSTMPMRNVFDVPRQLFLNETSCFRELIFVTKKISFSMI